MLTDVTSSRRASPPVRSALAVSVIVPVKDAWQDVAELLAALASQTLGRERFEVLVADDGSSEPAPPELAPDGEWLRVTAGPPVGSYGARNRAAELARAPVLAFCDADCRPEPDWLEAGLTALADADLVGGRIRFIAPRPPTAWSLLDIDTFLDQEAAVREGKAVTANLFIRREAFVSAGCFDASLPSGGDMELTLRCVAAGARLVYEPKAVVRHPTRDDARSFLGKMWRAGRASAARRTRRTGRRPPIVRFRSLVPLVGPLAARRRSGRPLRLDRRQLAAHGVDVRLRDELRALPLLYVLVPYVRLAARFRGWLDARGRR